MDGKAQGTIRASRSAVRPIVTFSSASAATSPSSNCPATEKAVQTSVFSVARQKSGSPSVVAKLAVPTKRQPGNIRLALVNPTTAL